MSQEFPHTATYSPQDDKIRLYFAFRIDKAEWNRLKALGFTWCMKQKEAGGCDMAAVWSVSREDAALELAGEIDDEDQPREERAAQRAERFEGYQEKREGEAHSLATRYENTPSIHGHQNAARAERAAARHDRLGAKAGTQWNKAEYWQRRTAGVIAHALYQERADVRHRRIKGIEAEIRKCEKDYERAAELYASWKKISAMTDAEKQYKNALVMAGLDHYYDYQHPTNAERRKTSLWSLLDDRQPEADRITGAQACELYFSEHSDPATWERRYYNHLQMRLAYEKQMLEAQGGTGANDTEIAPGGFVGKHQVLKISKDRAGRVSKVWLIGYGYQGSTRAVDAENIQPGTYRAPTAEELKAFNDANEAAKAAEPKAAPLINPTDEEAEKVQAAWNAERAKRRIVLNEGTGAVLRMTTAEYKTQVQPRLRGHHSTISINDDGTKTDVQAGEQCKARVRYAMGSGLYGVDCVVILTDAPQKPLPVTWKSDKWQRFKRRLERCGTTGLFGMAEEAGLTLPHHLCHGEAVAWILKNLPKEPAKELATV